jgi:hypothetical protein
MQDPMLYVLDFLTTHHLLPFDLFFILLLGIPFNILGTTFSYFFLLLIIFIILLKIVKKQIPKNPFFAKRNPFVIVLFLFLIINIIPFPLATHPYEGELGEYKESSAVAIGWPAVLGKFYLGPDNSCPDCPEKFGEIRLLPGFIPDTLIALILPILLGWYLTTKKKK